MQSFPRYSHRIAKIFIEFAKKACVFFQPYKEYKFIEENLNELIFLLSFKEQKHVFHRKPLALMETASFLWGDFSSPHKKI
jgi:hypothetical protein